MPLRGRVKCIKGAPLALPTATLPPRQSQSRQISDGHSCRSLESMAVPGDEHLHNQICQKGNVRWWWCWCVVWLCVWRVLLWCVGWCVCVCVCVWVCVCRSLVCHLGWQT